MAVSVTATARLRKDLAKLMKDPVPYVVAAPRPDNILEWHYVVTGAPGTPYEGGTYHGKLVFPSDFPFKPPSIYMITPSGRFQVNTRLCLSISDFHPDTWNPAWTVSAILNGLVSFMNSDEQTHGSIQSTEAEKRNLARKSRDFNLRDKHFCELFSELAKEMRAESERERQNGASSTATTSSAKSEPQQRASAFQSLAANFFIVIGAIALAFIVKYVIHIAEQDAHN